MAEEARKINSANLLLDEANRLIFVKQYGEAEKVLLQCLATSEGSSNLLVHLRRIELAAKLRKLPQVRDQYEKQMKSSPSTYPFDLCITFVDQYGESVPPTESLNRFQELIKQHGPNAAAYFGIGFSLEHQGNFERAIYNYQQSLALDPTWFPSYFGLSQIYYQKGDEKQGDHFFYLFEQAAPFNVYGNFETHRKLSQYFLERSRFAEAEAAIQTLSEWWIENRGLCPPEIRIYEALATAKIAETMGDKIMAENRLSQAKAIATQALEESTLKDNVLFFIAKLLEEFGELSLAFQYYKKIFRISAHNPAIIQKIGSQFLALREYSLAKELFEEAYNVYPDNPEIRFGLLVSNLKLVNVNVEDYLIGRERLRQLLDSQGDKVELLALLHSLLAKFQGDADVHAHMGDVYLRLGNDERAGHHYEKMYECDPKSRSAAIKYAAFTMQFGDPDKALEILNKVSASAENSGKEMPAEVFWLKANYYARKADYRTSIDILRKALEFDPWNLAYLTHAIVCLSAIANIDQREIAKISELSASLINNNPIDINWPDFDRQTARAAEMHAFELVYDRTKLRYLFANGSLESLRDVIRAARDFDPSQAIFDFMRLLNTNFDGPHIYWTLGILHQETWQLETASTWFEQVLKFPGVDKVNQRRAYLELADCYVWRNFDLPKAIEFAKLAIDLGERSNGRVFTVLAHAHLKKGQVRQARIYLEQTDHEHDVEARYLSGLIQYRNGEESKAKQIWKPLLTVRSESLRFHNIKQEILRYYFDKEPYLKAN